MTGSNPLPQGRIFGTDEGAIGQAVAMLHGGGIVAVPTETVYGLAADASNADAVAAIYRAKGRPDFNPLIVHVKDKAAAEALAVFDAMADRLAQAFWPGPLTLVLPLRGGAPVTAAVSAGLPTIAIRCPAHPVMQALLRQSGLALAAPSANRSGGISATRADHVALSLGDVVPIILDGGACEAGLESTIIAVRANGWQILRLGPVALEAIQKIVECAPLDISDKAIEAPGQLASHYAPNKPLRLNAQTAAHDEWHIGFGAIGGDDNLSTRGDMAEAAARLFDALHRADAVDRSRIAVAPIPDSGIGAAINDRLTRAATR